MEGVEGLELPEGEGVWWSRAYDEGEAVGEGAERVVTTVTFESNAGRLLDVEGEKLAGLEKDEWGIYASYGMSESFTLATALAGATLHLYADANDDGVADGAALAPSVTTVSTGGSPGSFTFSNLTPGRYLVVETDPSATYVSTNAIVGTGGTIAKVDANTLSFLITSASSSGNQFLDGPKTNTINVTVYSDTNGNGIVDAATDPVRASVPVTITRSGVNTYAAYTGTPATVSTTAGGLAAFTGVLGGNWTISVPDETGWTKLIVPTDRKSTRLNSSHRT